MQIILHGICIIFFFLNMDLAGADLLDFLRVDLIVFLDFINTLSNTLRSSTHLIGLRRLPYLIECQVFTAGPLY